MQTAGGRDSKTVVDEALRIVAAANESKVVLRIFGAAAIRQHCPNFGRMQDSLGRRIGDIDLASYDRYSSKVSQLIKGLGYEEDVTVSAFGGGRLIFRLLRPGPPSRRQRRGGQLGAPCHPVRERPSSDCWRPNS